MYNLLVSGAGWPSNRHTMMAGRMFEYTSDEVTARFKPNGVTDFNGLLRLPVIFMPETENRPNATNIARVGTIFRATVSGRDVELDYSYDPDIPPITNDYLEEHAKEFGIGDWEFNRTHWAVKDVDLFRVLLRHKTPQRSQPTVFQLAEVENIEPNLVSVMMPFAPVYDAVYLTLQRAAVSARMALHRADNIWEHSVIVQDIVSLIDRSRVVICDCTGKNSNVFYEIGIAHTLGREVIMITQNGDDIPFDLQHHRYVRYAPTPGGLALLQTEIQARLTTILTR